MLDLEAQAPDTSTAGNGANYKTFYSLVLSAHQYVEESYARGRRMLESSEASAYHEVVEISNEALARYPEHPFFQALKIEAEKISLVQAVVVKARKHEENGHYPEALEWWRMIRRIHGQYAGINAEFERLAVLTDSRDAQWVPSEHVPASVPATGATCAVPNNSPTLLFPLTKSFLIRHRIQRINRRSLQIALATTAALIIAISVWLLCWMEGSSTHYRLPKPRIAIGSVVDALSKPQAQSVPAGVSFQLFADFENGEIWLDDLLVGELKDSHFTLANISATQHTVRILGGRKQIQFRTVVDSFKAPTIESLATKDMTAFFMSNGANGFGIYASSTPKRILAVIDGQSVGTIGPQGLHREPLRVGQHELIIPETNQQRKIGFVVKAAPSLTVHLFSDGTVGSLLISVGQDEFEATLNGKPLSCKIEKGIMRVPNLRAGQYKLSIRKPGFYDAPEQTIAIRRGERVQVAITLDPIPQIASLTLKELPAGTQVFVDNSTVGTVGSDGRFVSSSVPVGERVIELRNPPQYRSSSRRMTFHAGETVDLGAAELKLEKIAAMVTLAISPSGAHISYKCGTEQSLARDVTGAFSVTCQGASLWVTASKPGFEDRTETWQLTPGDKKTFSVTLVPKHVESVDRHVYGLGELENLPHTPGQFEFRVVPEKRHRVKWVISGKSYYIDGNKFKGPGTKTKSIEQYAQHGNYAIRIDLTADSIVHSIRTPLGTWERLERFEDQTHNLLQGRIAFQDYDKLSSFSFREK